MVMTSPHWSDLAIEVGMGSETSTVHNTPIDHCAKCCLIVSHAHCVLISFIVNDRGTYNPIPPHSSYQLTVSFSLLQFKEVDNAHHIW